MKEKPHSGENVHRTCST